MTHVPRIATVQELPVAPAGKTGWPWTVEEASNPSRVSGVFPKITIVTPSFNQGQFIEETIRSVLLQGYPNLEYFILDGGSTDETVSIIKKYEPWLSGWVSEKDAGQSNAINKGWSKATGDIFAWINSDDWYLPNAFFRVVDLFNTTKCKWLVGSVRDCRAVNSLIKNFNARPTPLLNLLGRFDYGYHQPGMFWHREVWEKVGKLDEKLHYSFDHEFWARSLQQGFEPQCSSEYFSGFRYHETSKSKARHHLFLQEDWQVLERFRSSISAREYAQAYDWLSDYEADLLLNSAYGFLCKRQRAAAMKYLLTRVRLLPRLKPRRQSIGALVRVFLTGKPPSWFRC